MGMEKLFIAAKGKCSRGSSRQTAVTEASSNIPFVSRLTMMPEYGEGSQPRKFFSDQKQRCLKVYSANEV